MTKLNASESAMLLLKLAIQEMKAGDLRTQLARMRTQRAIDALEGNVDMEAFERKLVGEKNPTIIHGVNCEKRSHVGSGYLHSVEDDGPYFIDAVGPYCGRCHAYLN